MSNIAVVGVGSVGAAFAAALESDGRHRVLLCGRKDLNGSVVVETENGSRRRLEGPYFPSPDSFTDRVDWVVLAVKTYQVGGTASWLKVLCESPTKVVVLQNGIEHKIHVEPLVNGAPVLPGIIWSPAERIDSTHVRVRQRLRISVPQGVIGDEFVDLFRDADAQVSTADDFHSAAWRKLCINAVAGIMAVMGARAGIFESAAMCDLALRLAEECAEVGRADGAKISQMFPQQVVSELRGMPPDMGTSILFDRMSGQPLEWDARNAVVQRLGRSYGIPTPVSDVIAPMLEGISTIGVCALGVPGPA
ncbi:2-dehydropantoate 2-reductase [Embleya sp. NBC_00888]|uniref:2-dehydropantoate 2-reductase n=1 Tax=Embleya sp. NBC_00888 TaxID=2975960 RepID=UPI00386F8C6E|nr:2-dehydropantoate 2-reductase [Embleya sp. NBC_00888]